MNKKILFLFLILSLIFISGCFGRSDRYEYNGFTITKNQYGWAATVFLEETGKKERVVLVDLRYDPRSLEKENITFDDSIKNIVLNSTQVFITTDPNGTGKTSIAMMHLSKVLGLHPDWGVFKIRTENTLTKPGGEAPIKTCNDSNYLVTVIDLEHDKEENKIYRDRYCIIIEAKNEDDLIKLTDRLILTLLGVMK